MAQKSPRGQWTPARKDALFVGEISWAVAQTLRAMTGVRQVYVVPETLMHMQARHGDELDMAQAMEELPSILRAPKYVYAIAQKPNSVLFAGKWDQKHNLVVCIKVMQGELWLTTMYKMRSARVDTLVAKVGAIFARKE